MSPSNFGVAAVAVGLPMRYKRHAHLVACVVVRADAVDKRRAVELYERVEGQRPADWRKIGLIAGSFLLLAGLMMLYQLFVQSSDSLGISTLAIWVALFGIVVGAVLGYQGSKLNDA